MREIYLHSELRHLPRQVISELGNILQLDLSWREVMGLIPGNQWTPGEDVPLFDYEKKYTSEDICLVEEECKHDGRTGFEVIVEEWGTSGRVRPKIQDLINILYRAGLERAASHLQNCVRDEDKEMSSKTLEISQSKTVQCMSSKPNEISLDIQWDLPCVLYEDIMKAVNGGSIIGNGAFGSVYKASILLGGENNIVAIKILNESDDASKQHLSKEKVFKTEVELLSKCFHENILTLEGYSHDQSDLALIYPFMENGSLFDRLACLESTPPLAWDLRLRIARGTAEGIVYLHSSFNPPLVHRDVKSPNILLDEHLIPKLGDFGIVRFGSHGVNANTAVKTVPIGTQMYMAPEAFRGDVSVKMDAFSFGVVLLELLTGLPYFDENRENRDLLSLVEDFEDDPLELLDAQGGDWPEGSARALFGLAENCSKEKRERPDMVRVLESIKEIESQTDC